MVEEVPLGAATESFVNNKNAFLRSQPAALTRILADNNALGTYGQFVEAMGAVSSSSLLCDLREIWEAHLPYVAKFKEHNIRLQPCYKRVSGSKGRVRNFVWFVYIDLGKLPDYTPRFTLDIRKVEDSESCPLM